MTTRQIREATRTLPPGLKPGMWGVAHGSGWLGSQIRNIELKLSVSKIYPQGNRRACWAAHAFVFAGNHVLVQGKPPEPCIVEATYPNVRLSSAYSQDAVWATGQPLTPDQLKLGVISALGQVGMHYDWPAYFYYLNALAHMAFLNDLSPLFSLTAKMGPICSGVVVREMGAMKADITGLPTAASEDPDFVSPADLSAWGLKNGWMNRPFPAW
jgi:hypothetical protein